MTPREQLANRAAVAPLELSPHEGGPPRDLEIERAVLGTMLTDGAGVAIAVREGLTERTFHYQPHKLVFRVLRDIPAERVDLLTVNAELERRGDLEAARGTAYVAGLLDSARVVKNLPGLVAQLVELEQGRAVLDSARHLAEAARSDPRNARELAAATAAELQAIATSGRGSGSLADAARHLEQLTPEQLRRPAPLFGGGLLCCGDLAVLAGQPGLGKSRLALELAVSLARGESWLNLPAGERPVRVGYVAAEFTAYRLLARCVTLFGGGPAPDDSGELLEAFRRLQLTATGGELLLIPADAPGAQLDLVSARGALELQQLITENNLDLVILDPLSRLMGDREETNEVFGQLVTRLDPVRFATGAALLLAHHERKTGAQQDRSKTDDLDAVRGGTKLTAAANTVLRLSRTTGGLLRLTFPKANHARTPEAIYHRVPDDGGRTVLEESPEARADATRERFEAWTRGQAGRTFTTAEAAAGAGTSRPTARKYLAALAQAGQLEERKGARGGSSWAPAPESGKDRKNLAVSPWEDDDPQSDMPL